MLTRRDLIAAALPLVPPRSGLELVQAARLQIGVTVRYDGAYRPIGYPNGDGPRAAGACCDVVVRAARDAWRIDLQRLVHEDMARACAAYPHDWGLRGPDPNIDHRRVLNLETYFTRVGARLWRTPHVAYLSGDIAAPVQPGDILTWRTFPFGGPHIALVSCGGRWPRIIQNHGFGVREDWLLQQWLDAAVGWYRWRG